jgi:hypothetical protein
MAHKEQAGRKRRSSEMSRVRVARRYSMLIVVNFVLRCTRRAGRGEKNEPLRVCATPCQVGAFFYYNAHENFPFLLWAHVEFPTFVIITLLYSRRMASLNKILLLLVLSMLFHWFSYIYVWLWASCERSHSLARRSHIHTLTNLGFCKLAHTRRAGSAGEERPQLIW